MKKLQLIISVVLGLCSCEVLSANISAGNYTIQSLRVSEPSGLVYIIPESDVNVKNHTCSKADMFALERTSAMYEDLYSVVLSAAMTSKSIELWVSDEESDCSWA